MVLLSVFIFYNLVFKINHIKNFFYQLQEEEKGTDPSLIDFYFRTHRKKDQSWVGVHAEAAYVSPILFNIVWTMQF